MTTIDGCGHDVMLVCANGHVITDLLRTYPERGLSHCDHCGAATIDHCPTCGHELPGAVYVPGLVPVGLPRPPHFCAICGAAFPWTEGPSRSFTADPWTVLEPLLRRLPLAIRQLRFRQGDRPAFLVRDERDLEDLLRALLSLHCDDARWESRTPSYAVMTRTDFLLRSAETVLIVKRVSSPRDERRLVDQLQEDVSCYQRRPGCRNLIVLFYDPEGLLHEPRQLEIAWSKRHDELDVRCIIST